MVSPAVIAIVAGEKANPAVVTVWVTASAGIDIIKNTQKKTIPCFILNLFV
jgi:hypothetical protein